MNSLTDKLIRSIGGMDDLTALGLLFVVIIILVGVIPKILRQ